MINAAYCRSVKLTLGTAVLYLKGDFSLGVDLTLTQCELGQTTGIAQAPPSFL